MRWMNLEPVIQSEVSQRKTNYCLLIDIYGIHKDGTDERVCRVAVETQTWGTGLWTQRGKQRAG